MRTAYGTKRAARGAKGPEGLRTLVGTVAAEAAARARQTGRAVVHARAVPVGERVGAVWFRWMAEAGRLSWVFAAPDGEQAVGVGEAARWAFPDADGLARMARAWQDLASDAALPRALVLGGGWAFSVDALADAWSVFPAVGFVLPALTLRRRSGRWTLAAAVRAHPGDRPAALAQEMLGAWRGRSGEDGEARRLVETRFTPAPEGYVAAVRDAVAAIAAGRLDKVVLARAVELRFDRTLPVARLWRQIDVLYPDTYRFAVRQPEGVFLGASPEVLVQVERGRVEAMSLAGTAPADRPAEELAASLKEREEHAVVREEVVRGLARITAGTVVVGTPRVVGGRFVQHLLTPVTGRLASDRTIWDAAAALHPTPAVGGRPREAALEWIREREGWPRGWYAGAVGTVDLAGDGRFVVALRSTLVRGAAATLFAGAGVVRRSVAEREWEETSWKMLPMLTALARATAASGRDSTETRLTRRHWVAGSRRWWRGLLPVARTRP